MAKPKPWRRTELQGSRTCRASTSKPAALRPGGRGFRRGAVGSLRQLAGLQARIMIGQISHQLAAGQVAGLAQTLDNLAPEGLGQPDQVFLPAAQEIPLRHQGYR